MDVGRIYRAALGAETSPDHWQRVFAEREWPQVLVAPTGSGKTAAITLGWAALRMRSPKSTPRRLVWCLPMRALVDQTAQAIKGWFDRLAAERLDENGALPPSEDVHVLMGGVEASRWLDHPERPAVIVGTQDMLLSRALMRGYASSRAVWPMEFALLHEDTQWVFDEVQLMEAGRATSAQLEAFRQSEAARAENEGIPGGCPARSVWISATLDPGWLRTVDFPAPVNEMVRRVDPRIEADERLRRLSSAKKTLNRAGAAPASAKADDLDAYISELADAVLETHRPGHMTLVVLNRVTRAQALHAVLRKKINGDGERAAELALVHARFRPCDRQREMKRLLEAGDDGGSGDLIVVATQAVEAGVDVSAAVLFTELAPWPSMVQRFGRANRYANLDNGADVRWIDLLNGRTEHDRDTAELALPYAVADLVVARERLLSLADVASVCLPETDATVPPRRVIRRRDLDDLFDTDPDLTGFDLDVSPYIRDAGDTDIRVFWRDLSDVGNDPPLPSAGELCAVQLGAARRWLFAVRKKRNRNKSNAPFVFVRDPQWRRNEEGSSSSPPGWMPLRGDPWPGLTLLVDVAAGGYDEMSGFTGNPDDVPKLPPLSTVHEEGEAEGHQEDPRSGIGVPISLPAHLEHVALEAQALCDALGVDSGTRAAVVRAARWHDLGKAHEVFQQTMRRGLDREEVPSSVLLAKTKNANQRCERAYFRHELASGLAFLAQEEWSREADLVAYLVVAHHGKVRMNLRALPRERAPSDEARPGARFARGIWEGDELSPLDLGDGERWEGGCLTLSIMELGFDELTRESWTERTRDLLDRFGPFRLAWMETLLRLADWRASAKERDGGYGGC